MAGFFRSMATAAGEAKIKRIALFVLLLACLAVPAPALQVPRYQGYVNDYADMISPETRGQLERALQSFDLSDSTQVAVLIIESLEGDNLEDFSIRVVDDWQIGQRGRDNGVLLLIAEKERKMRIEVGRGLEGVLTDLAAGRIIDNVITPLFKDGRYDEGVAAGVGAIIKTVRGEYTADDLQNGGPRTSRGDKGGTFFSYLIMGAIFAGFLGNISRLLSSAAGALFLPFIVFMALSIPFSMVLLLILMAAGALGGFLLPVLMTGAAHRGTGGYYPGGGFSGRGGGGFSSGGFGGFGGGGFGGGGASGGW